MSEGWSELCVDEEVVGLIMAKVEGSGLSAHMKEIVWREVRKRGMDTIPRYPRRAAGDFANSTWPEAKMIYTHTPYFP